MRFVDALDLELKKVAFRGVRMSRAQRRNAATRGDSGPSYWPKPGHTYDPDGDYSSSYSGPKAKRATGQSARAKRLAAAGIGPGKTSKRAQDIRRARTDLMTARQRARTFINSNARRSTRDLGLF